MKRYGHSFGFSFGFPPFGFRVYGPWEWRESRWGPWWGFRRPRRESYLEMLTAYRDWLIGEKEAIEAELKEVEEEIRDLREESEGESDG